MKCLADKFTDWVLVSQCMEQKSSKTDSKLLTSALAKIAQNVGGDTQHAAHFTLSKCLSFLRLHL